MPYSVTVSTADFEFASLGSNPSGAIMTVVDREKPQ